MKFALIAAALLTSSTSVACPNLSGIYKSCTARLQAPAFAGRVSDVVIEQDIDSSGVTTYTINSAINGASNSGPTVLRADGLPISDGKFSTTTVCAGDVLQASTLGIDLPFELKYFKSGVDEITISTGSGELEFSNIVCK